MIDFGSWTRICCSVLSAGQWEYEVSLAVGFVVLLWLSMVCMT